MTVVDLAKRRPRIESASANNAADIRSPRDTSRSTVRGSR